MNRRPLIMFLEPRSRMPEFLAIIAWREQSWVNRRPVVLRPAADTAIDSNETPPGDQEAV